MKKIRKGDTVKVIAGKFKGTVAPVEAIVGDTGVIVKGVNVMKKAVKGKGFIDKILPIHISNVMYYDEKAKAVVKVGTSIDKNGKKSRIAKKSGDAIK